jgi:hypothetical protein
MAARRAHEKAQAQADAAEGDAMKAKAALGDNGLDPSTLKSAQKLVKSLSAVQKLKDRAEKAQAAVEKKQAAQAKTAERAQAEAERDVVQEAKAQAKVKTPEDKPASMLPPSAAARARVMQKANAVRLKKSSEDRYRLVNRYGSPVGELHVTESLDGKSLYVHNIEGMDGANAFGSSAIRDLKEQLKKEFPKAETVSGFRINGARGDNGANVTASLKPASNRKANGSASSGDGPSVTRKLDDYPEAPWAYADTNREAAKMVLDHEQANGRSIAHPDGYTRSVERRLNGLDAALLAVGKDATSHGDKEVVQTALARIKSTRSPAAAKEFKEVLKQELPQPQRQHREASIRRETRRTMETSTERASLIQWRRVNAEPFEYAIQQGPHGDEFVGLLDGSCLRRSIDVGT